jgi:hypothetical protein
VLAQYWKILTNWEMKPRCKARGFMSDLRYCAQVLVTGTFLDDESEAGTAAPEIACRDMHGFERHSASSFSTAVHLSILSW